MARYLFMMQCKPGCEQEYVVRHKAVFPELLETLTRLGIRNYSIFMRGTQLYAYLEVDDFDSAMNELALEPSNRRWQEYMSDILVTENGNPAIDRIDNEVFYFDY